MARGRELPWFLPPGSPPRFPDPGRFDRHGLVAVGGDLGVERLLHAYAHGIFPWYNGDTPPLWWSPDPRAQLRPDGLHVSASLQRKLGRGRFTLSWNGDFAGVMTACGENRPEGTWVIPEMVEGYCRLHAAGHAHSLEVRCDGVLAGGIYGVQVGALFAAESMFHRVTDMSKVALVALVRSLFRAGITWIDVQFMTPHLQRMGALPVTRAAYLKRLPELGARRVELAGLVPDWRG